MGRPTQNATKTYITPEMLSELLNRIETVIEDVCLECGYDQQNLKATNWTYILYEIGKRVFSHYPELLKGSDGVYIIDNIDLIYDNIYSPLCDKYGTIKGISPFCKMLGIYYKALMHVWDERGRLTSTNVNLFKKLVDDRRESLQDNMLNSNTNPIKFLSLLNHEYGLNEVKIERIEDSKPVLSLDDIPELPDMTAEKELPEKLALPNFEDDDQ